MFSGRKAVIATMHGKESVISPVLEQKLGLHCFVPDNYNTDLLGTFTGEVERQHDPLTTARLKCLGAMDLTGTDIGIASEGSFGPAPGAFFLPCNEEWLILVDRKLQLEIVVNERTYDTNFSGRDIHSREELEQFAASVLFPTHGLIVRKNRNAREPVYKGIRDYETLFATYEILMGGEGICYAETDMRAMHNPTRMEVIRRAAEKMAVRASTSCPSCKMPGFGVTEAVPGLPCAWCGLPTRRIRCLVSTCSSCGYFTQSQFPDGITAADPGVCDVCNP